jgi:hypothetical protein
MIPDYLKLNPDMSLSPDVEKFLENREIEWGQIQWSGDMDFEGVKFKVGFVKSKKSVVLISSSKCFSISIEEYITQIKMSE